MLWFPASRLKQQVLVPRHTSFVAMRLAYSKIPAFSLVPFSVFKLVSSPAFPNVKNSQHRLKLHSCLFSENVEGLI